MAIRLAAIITSLNISRDRAVEFLQKKNLIGGEISDNPKLNEEQENALRREFSSDMTAKVKAEQLIKQKEKKEKPKQEPQKIETTTEKVEVKTLGKIDLDDLDGRKARARAKAKAEADAKVKAEEEARAKAEAEAKAKAEAEAKAKAKAKAEADAKAKAEAEAEAEAKAAKDEEVKDETSAPEETNDAPEGDDAANGPKILGKIDLSSINSSTRPKKKSKEEKRKEREEKAKATQQQRQNANGEKKKRERINKQKVDINQAAKQVNQQQPANAKNKIGKKSKAKGKPIQEVNDEDVARQVKETLARLTSKNQSNKNAAKYRRDKREAVAEQAAKQAAAENAESKVLKLTEYVTVSDLATMMNIGVTQVISTLMSVGVMASINQRLEAETINLVAEEFGFKTEYVSAEVQEAIIEEADNEEDLIARAPVVTVMGHVDHGKTSLLDYIRNSNVIAGEAGGITQHIGAYNVKLDDGRRITFLDTPGHEAFTAMRARGTQVTDIAIIIIAADDSVMPTTKEAIAHAQAANVPMVFAINKIDKPGANPDKIREDLSQMNLLVEEWGGKYQCQEISAKKGINV
ncbi:MAG: translation initiation factor IF-2 N-terminal domain-containing protein, partial [Bacteroidaceae bacterium]|nr:translation initiation factor IF-2 N-terminal domain-containing protein [Bacteroidaceae bacterium]